jgi:hypothetical protein
MGWLLTAQAQNLPVPLSNQQFANALEQIDRETFERDRFRVAENLLNRHYLLAEQVRQLLTRFNFKTQQEQLAQMAYAKVYDQSNFYQVYSAFNFDDSRNKIRAWVGEQPRNELERSFRPMPMSEANFNTAYQTLQQADFDSEVLGLAKEIVADNYLYAVQVRDLIQLLDFKTSEDDLAKFAYSKTYDQQNYYLVLDALTFTSSKRSLSNWLKGQPVMDYSNYGYDNNSNTRTWTSPYDDGDNINTAIRYSGTDRGQRDQFDNNPPRYDETPVAPVVVSDADFTNIRNQLNQIPADKDRLIRVKQISDQSNWTTEQVRDLMDMMVFENMRLDFAMYAYQRTTDAQNYYLVQDALSDADNRQRLADYVQSVGGSLRNPSSVTNNNPNLTYNPTNRPQASGTQTLPTSKTAVQVLSPSDFQTSKSAIEGYSSDSDRLKAAKSIVDEQFLLTDQVGELIQLFVFDDVRLEFAKYAYPKTQDQANYEQLVALMQNASTQESLMLYLNEN